MSSRAVTGVVAAVVVALLLVPASAASVRPPGPALQTSPAALSRSLTCSEGLRDARREPVLLVAGTGATAAEQYGWSYEPALTAQDIPWCAVTMPHHTLGDIQVDADFLVHAIRRMHAVAGRRIAIVGHSQGGMIPRWALRFWPDTRADVADMIGLAADNHGTSAITTLGICSSACVPAAWQQVPGSAFLRALNRPAETFRSVDYTEVFTRYDALSTPAGPGGTSPLRTGPGRVANVEIQSVCPLDVADHVLLGTTDPVAFALVMDAITHRGPASAGRIQPSVCTRLLLPGIDLSRASGVLTALPFLLSAATPFNVVGATKVTAPPRLRSYALTDR